MTKKICISGYYGFNNFGDETILKILVSNLKSYINDAQITVFSSNPNQTSSELSVNSVYSFDIKSVVKSIIQTDCLISGGGSLLQDSTSIKSLIYYLFVIIIAQIFRKKTIIFAQGIGPINNKFLLKLTLLLIKRASFVSVRDNKSYDLLKKSGIEAHLFPDPVWNLPIPNIRKMKRLIVQLREHKFLTDSFLRELAQSVSECYKETEIVILSLQNKLDLDVCNRFKAILLEKNHNLNVKVIENTSNDDVISNILSSNELIAMRYHACLIGVKAGVKVLPLSYDIKVEELAKEFSMEYIDLSDNTNISDKIKEFKTSNISLKLEEITAKQFDFKLMTEKI